MAKQNALAKTTVNADQAVAALEKLLKLHAASQKPAHAVKLEPAHAQTANATKNSALDAPTDQLSHRDIYINMC